MFLSGDESKTSFLGRKLYGSTLLANWIKMRSYADEHNFQLEDIPVVKKHSAIMQTLKDYVAKRQSKNE